MHIAIATNYSGSAGVAKPNININLDSECLEGSRAYRYENLVVSLT